MQGLKAGFALEDQAIIFDAIVALLQGVRPYWRVNETLDDYLLVR